MFLFQKLFIELKRIKDGFILFLIRCFAERNYNNYFTYYLLPITYYPLPAFMPI